MFIDGNAKIIVLEYWYMQTEALYMSVFLCTWDGHTSSSLLSARELVLAPLLTMFLWILRKRCQASRLASSCLRRPFAKHK